MKNTYSMIKNMIIKRRDIILSLISYFSFSVLSTIIGILNITYLTRTLLPDQYAYEGICYGIIYFVTPLISFSANGLIGINIINFTKEDYFSYKRSYLSFGIINFSIISLITLGIYFQMFRDQMLNCVFILLISFVSYISEINDTELIQSKKSITYGVVKTILNSLKLFLSYIFISLIKMDWEGRLTAILISELLFAAIRIFLLSDKDFKFYFQLSLKDIKRFVVYGLPVIISVGGGWIISESQRFIVLSKFSMTEVGYYTVAARIGILITIFNVALLNTIYPIIYSKLKQKIGYEFVFKITLIYFTVLLFIALVAIFILYYFGDIILGKQYTNGKIIIILMITGYIFSNLYKIPSLVLEYYKDNILRTVLVYISAFVGLAITYLGVSKIGVVSPALGMLCSFLILTLLYMKYAGKIMKREEVL